MQIERQITLHLTLPFTLFALPLQYTYFGEWDAKILFWEDPLLEESLLKLAQVSHNLTFHATTFQSRGDIHREDMRA